MRPTRAILLVAILLPCIVGATAAAQDTPAPADWTIYVTNDNCPDYTWA